MASVRNLPSFSELIRFLPSSFNGQSLVCHPPASNSALGRPWYLPPGQMPPPNELFPPEPECQIQRPVRVADNQWQATHSIARKDHALGDFVASPSHNRGQPADQFPSTPLLNDKQISNANFAATHITDLPQQSYHHGKRDHHRVKKRRRHAATHVPCERCENNDTPEWRRGPNGPATLCNACGLRYAKQQRKLKRDLNSTTAELEAPTAAAQEGSIKAYSAHGSSPQVYMY